MKLNNITFEQDILKCIKSEFANFNQNLPEDISLIDALFVYRNWRQRFIGPGSREVFYSKELKNNPSFKNNNFRKVIEKIEYKLKNYDDLTPFLSKGIADHPIVIPNNPNNEKDRDLLLNSFGIHHLHLGSGFENKEKFGISFLKRGNELLIAYVQKDKVYFIDILEHDVFPYEKKIFTIMQNNWPELLKPFEMEYLIDIQPKPTNNEMKDLVKLHINAAVEINNKFYSFGTQTMNGYNTNGRFDIISFIKQINQDVVLIEGEKNKIKSELIKKIKKNIENLDLHIVIKNGLFFYVEEQTKATIYLDLKENKRLHIFSTYCVLGTHSYDLNS